MLSIAHLEVGTLATFLRLALPRVDAWPLALERYRNGALGQNWIHSARKWQRGERIIDVGCGYSDLPLILAALGCNVWGADDFGLKSGDIYWLRGKHPEDFVKQHPQVRYVFERLGEANSSFEDDYFDVVISNQALHVAKPPHTPIWRDMLRVMKKQPGSEMLISMICNFGSDGAPAQAIERMSEIRRMEESVLGRMADGKEVPLSELEAMQQKAGQSFHRFSPALYVAYVATGLGVGPFAMPSELLAENYCTRVNSLIDPASVGFNNARFSNSPEEARKFRYGRYSPVLMKLVWGAAPRGFMEDPTASSFEKSALWNAMLRCVDAKPEFVLQPMGTSQAVNLVENAENSTHMLTTELDAPANEELEVSILARPSGRNFLGLWLRGASGSDDLVEVFYDLGGCLVTATTQHGQSTLKRAAIEPVGDGWVRCKIGGIASVSPGLARLTVLIRRDAGGSSQYPGEPHSGVSICTPVVTIQRKATQIFG